MANFIFIIYVYFHNKIYKNTTAVVNLAVILALM